MDRRRSVDQLPRDPLFADCGADPSGRL